MRRFAIMTDDPGWHGDELRAAFSLRGCEATFVSLSGCRFDISAPHGLIIPGFEGLPDGVFVRSISAGTLEQITLRLGVLHALQELGVPVYNDARSIERSVDKSMTSFLLKSRSIPTPPTWVSESEPATRALVMRETAAGRELVLKPLFGSQGKGLRRIVDIRDLPSANEMNGVFYLQRFIDCGEGNWHDWRVFVIGGRAVAAMIRRGKTWINNVAQGADCEAAELTPRLGKLAEEASRTLGMDYAGIDVIRDPAAGYSVIEVNSIPAWKGLQTVCSLNIAQALVDDLLAHAFPLQLMGAR
jgi:RimK family alpha-L-glutamate ligase